MKTYTVKKIYKYSEIVKVEADSVREAKDLACGMEGDRRYDDYLYDCDVIDEQEIEP